jgi:hypothetical protein
LISRKRKPRRTRQGFSFLRVVEIDALDGGVDALEDVVDGPTQSLQGKDDYHGHQSKDQSILD